MKILFVSPEVAPFAKTGGLADVAQALPTALKKMGHDVRTIMPRYLTMAEQVFDRVPLESFSVQMNNGLQGAGLWQGDNEGVPTYFIENDAYFNREGFYGIGDWDYPDNLERFVFFCKAALEASRVVGFAPDVIHCNDWQTAPLAAILKGCYAAYRRDPFFMPVPKLVYAIHNISYQGRFPEDQWPVLSLPHSYYRHDFEFHGQINLTKGAIQLSDAIVTVSETYAREIQTTDFGFGLQGVLASRKADLYGILNGVNYDQWCPETDPHAFGLHYSAEDLAGKRQIKSKLRGAYGLADRDEVPLIGVITRFVEQKGIDLITACADEILQFGTQMIVLGSGEQRYQDLFEDLRRRYPRQVGVYIGFNNELAHQIEAGADIFLMPSLFEPCGLNQIYSLRYGTLPIVRLTGGLADTVEEGVTGFTFFDFTGAQLLDAVKRAVDLFRRQPEAWRRMMLTAMGQDFSWERSAKRYSEVYEMLSNEMN